MVRIIYDRPFAAATTGMHCDHGGQSSERKVPGLGHKRRRLFSLLQPEGHVSSQESQNFRVAHVLVRMSSGPPRGSLHGLRPSHRSPPAGQVWASLNHSSFCYKNNSFKVYFWGYRIASASQFSENTVSVLLADNHCPVASTRLREETVRTGQEHASHSSERGSWISFPATLT